MKTVAFYNPKGGVGTTSIVYHLAWMFADLGVRVAAVDFDPQADLTALLMGEEFDDGPWTFAVDKQWRLVPASLQMLCEEDGQIDERFRDSLGALHMLPSLPPELVLVDVGPGLSVFERTALRHSEHVILMAAPETRALRGIDVLEIATRDGRLSPNLAGYVALRHGCFGHARGLLPLDAIAAAYHRLLRLDGSQQAPIIGEDPNCLAQLRHYRSIMPMALAAGKPMFHLTPVDGAIGAHVEAVLEVRADFARLARRIAAKVGIEVPG